MKVAAIVLAAGQSRRFKNKTLKPLFKINRQPILIYSLKTLNKIGCIKDIIVVANPETRKSIISKIREFGIDKVTKVVDGGRRRQDSVYKGLLAVDRSLDLVLIHDGARPFIDRRTVLLVIKKAGECGAAVAGVPVKATVKQVKSKKVKGKSTVVVEKTLNRDRLWEVQTPQVFKRDLILKAYDRLAAVDVTDDASLVERLGVKVCLAKGSYFNIKITTPEDTVVAEAIARHIRQ